MTSGRIIKLVLSLLFVLAVFPLSANAFWVLDDMVEDEVEIELTRVDYEDPDCPYHEMTEGVYGFFDEQAVFVPVIDFNNSNPYVAPYTAEDIHWVSGPLDK